MVSLLTGKLVTATAVAALQVSQAEQVRNLLNDIGIKPDALKLPDWLKFSYQADVTSTKPGQEVGRRPLCPGLLPGLAWPTPGPNPDNPEAHDVCHNGSASSTLQDAF